MNIFGEIGQIEINLLGTHDGQVRIAAFDDFLIEIFNIMFDNFLIWFYGQIGYKT